MPARFFVDPSPPPGEPFALPPGTARHVQVLRLQPGDAVLLFDGSGREFLARIVQIGRSSVEVRVESSAEVDRELGIAVTVALGMPANERMDAFVEKAAELGAAHIQPLVCDRSVLRPVGERAQKKVAHWQAVAVAACEQCGRARLPRVAPVASLRDWLASLPAVDGATTTVRWLLSPQQGALPLPTTGRATSVTVLSGPEGGFGEAEEAAARRHGFVAATLGPRILRADTAPLAALVRIGGWPGAGPSR